MLLGRTRDRDLGWGPYLRLGHSWGSSTHLAMGGSILVPLSPTYPFVLSAGPLLEAHPSQLNPGAELWLFWGPSSYNFHSSYSMASGLLLGAQKTWGDTGATTLALAGQLDLALVSMPFIALLELVRGPPARQ